MKRGGEESKAFYHKLAHIKKSSSHEQVLNYESALIYWLNKPADQLTATRG